MCHSYNLKEKKESKCKSFCLKNFQENVLKSLKDTILHFWKCNPYKCISERSKAQLMQEKDITLFLLKLMNSHAFNLKCKKNQTELEPNITKYLVSRGMQMPENPLCSLGSAASGHGSWRCTAIVSVYHITPSRSPFSPSQNLNSKF